MISVQNITKVYESRPFLGSRRHLSAVSDVSLVLLPGKTIGLVGESGCGKSTLGKIFSHLIKPTSGKIFYQGRETSSFDKTERFLLRKDIQIVFQDPFSSLNPRHTVFQMLSEILLYHKISIKQSLKQSVIEILQRVGLREEHLNRYPHEFSGGQRQRLVIARALSVQPKVIICDEPVSALDVSIQSQIINLLIDLQSEFSLTYLFISHNLSVVKHISTDVAVMYLGKIVEYGSSNQIFEKPSHPYTKLLLDSIPNFEQDKISTTEESFHLSNESIFSKYKSTSCSFIERCSFATHQCADESPALNLSDKSERKVACHNPLVDKQ